MQRGVRMSAFICQMEFQEGGYYEYHNPTQREDYVHVIHIFCLETKLSSL